MKCNKLQFNDSISKYYVIIIILKRTYSTISILIYSKTNYYYVIRL